MILSVFVDQSWAFGELNDSPDVFITNPFNLMFCSFLTVLSTTEFAVIEHAYQLGDTTQKLELVMELYSPEFQLFKDQVPSKESR